MRPTTMMRGSPTVFVQWIVILVLLCICSWQYDQIKELQRTNVSATCRLVSAPSVVMPHQPHTEQRILSEQMVVHRSHRAYSGVAVTTFLGAPKWFQNRYSLMVNQVLSMVEDDWVVQIVYDPAQKMALEGISYPGIQRQIRWGRIMLTPIPKSMAKIKKNALLLSVWFWESLLAENVLLFGGTAAVCANSPYEIGNFTKYDYIGAPWGSFQGRGGEGGVSIRKKTTILGAVRRYNGHVKHSGAGSNVAKEDAVLVRALLEEAASVRVATKEETQGFAANNNLAIGAPLAVSGTLAGLDDDARQRFLDYCPEMKMMFPSLHNSACFGAEPNALECFKYLCITSRLRCGEKFTDISFVDRKNRRVRIHISIESQ